MTYDPIKPQALDLLSQSQADIQTNFNQANVIMGINHVNFNNPTAVNRGKHTFVTMIEGGDPALVVNEICHYCKDLGGVSTWYMRKEGGAGTIIQMSGPDPVSASPGQTFLPGGIILKWGFFAMGAGVTTVDVIYPIAFPVSYFVVTLTRTNATTADEAGVLLGAGTTRFQFRAVRTGTTNITYFYIALGN